MKSNAISVSLMVLLVLALGCGGGGDTGKVTDTSVEAGPEDLVEADVVVPPYTFMPPALKLQTFTVLVETDSTLLKTGAAVALAARMGRGEADGELSYVWDVDGGDVVQQDGAAMEVSFSTAGRYLVQVTATDEAGETASAGVLLSVVEGVSFLVGDVDGDGEVAPADLEAAEAQVGGDALLTEDEFDRADVDLDGRLDQADLDLIQNAIDDGQGAPAALWPAAGSLGTRLRLIHPLLLNLEDRVQVQFEGSDPMTPMRGKPGYAAFVVPPDQDAAKDIELRLLVNGEEAAAFAFQVLPLPAASAEPGAKVVEAFEELETLLQYMPGLIHAYADAMQLTEDEQATLRGMLEVSLNSYTAHQAKFIAAFGMMGPDGRAAFEQVALGNGLDDVLADIQDMRTYLESIEEEYGLLNDQISIGAANTLIGVLCAAQQIADISSKVAEINEIASGYLDWFDWWPLNKAPIVGQVITFLSGLSTAIGAITDIIGVVAEYLPEFGDLEAEAKPGVLDIGVSTNITVTIEIVISTKLCGKAAGAGIDSLMGTLNDALSKRLGGMIPLASSAFKKAKWDRDNMGTILGLVYDAVSAISGAILDALGIQGVLENLADKICALLENPTLPVDPDKIDATCGAVGAGIWTCTVNCIGSVGFTATKTLCGEKKTGGASVGCNGCTPENCGGCCSGDALCVEFPQQTDLKCGAGGTPCKPCPEHHECTAGSCVCTSDCPTAGEKKCLNNAVYACVVLVDAPPCLRWTLEKACENGATCVDGKCEGGCNAENCTGCCQADGTCITETSTDNCGINGSTCGYCAGSCEECINGVCTCVPQCEGKECGSDCCGGSCGECPGNYNCVDGNCICQPNCGGKECGDDGCGGSCGSCPDGQNCSGGQCVEGPKMCKCGDPGVTLDPGSCPWGDAAECSAWHSVADANGENSEDEFPDGTEFSAYGCTIKIVCP